MDDNNLVRRFGKKSKKEQNIAFFLSSQAQAKPTVRNHSGALLNHSRTMFEAICTYPLPSDLFSQAIHPTEPLIAVGLASGHVQTFRLPSLPSSNESTNSKASALANGCGTIDTIWKTRRHKGSCRSVVYSSDGSKLFSAGTDGLVKMADTNTGKVESKIAVPNTSL